MSLIDSWMEMSPGVWLVAPHLRGWQKMLIVLLPISGWSASYFMTAWPSFIALNWTMPNYLAWLVSLSSLGICLIVVRGVAAVVTRQASEKFARAATTPRELAAQTTE